MSRAKNKHIDPERLINLRKEMGFTQKTLSEKSNVTLSTIKRFERGEGYPNSLNLSDLSKSLQCDSEYLTGESEFINRTYRIAERIKTLRKRQGLTQKQLAEKMGVSLDTVKSWEIRRRVPTSYIILIKLSEVLNTSPDYILD